MLNYVDVYIKIFIYTQDFVKKKQSTFYLYSVVKGQIDFFHTVKTNL